MTEKSITSSRLDVASAAVGEIGMLTEVLRAQIQHHHPGTCDPIAMLSRGVLARIDDLAEIVNECLGNGDDWSDAELARMVFTPHRNARIHVDAGIALSGSTSIAEATR